MSFDNESFRVVLTDLKSAYHKLRNVVDELEGFNLEADCNTYDTLSDTDHIIASMENTDNTDVDDKNELMRESIDYLKALKVYR